MTSFHWTDADRAKLVPGATVTLVDMERDEPQGDQTVHHFDGPRSLWLGDGRFGVDIGWHVDHATIRPPRQLDLFGGSHE